MNVCLRRHLLSSSFPLLIFIEVTSPGERSPHGKPFPRAVLLHREPTDFRAVDESLWTGNWNGPVCWCAVKAILPSLEIQIHCRLGQVLHLRFLRSSPEARGICKLTELHCWQGSHYMWACASVAYSMVLWLQFGMEWKNQRTGNCIVCTCVYF